MGIYGHTHSMGIYGHTHTHTHTQIYAHVPHVCYRLSASTYPANRDFENHVGGVRVAAPQGFFFSIFFDFFCYIFTEKKGDVLTNI